MTVPGARHCAYCARPDPSQFFWDTMRSWGAAPYRDTAGRDVPDVATLGFTNPTAHSIPYSKDANYFLNNSKNVKSSKEVYESLVGTISYNAI